MLNTILDYGQIIIADIVLSGDNALIIGMAAVSYTHLTLPTIYSV